MKPKNSFINDPTTPSDPLVSDKASVQSYQRHGRTTAITDHSDLQVLRRIRRYLLPKDFTVSQNLLDEMVAGYDIGDPLADALATDGVRFAKPLQKLIIDDQSN
ncbi:hypothetical protein ACS8FD_24490, partial [Psychrobacter sp. 1U2]